MIKTLLLKDLLKPCYCILLLVFNNPANLQAQEEINVVGNIQTIADGDITPSLVDRTDFDVALISGGSVVRSFSIQNTGSGNLTINSITGTGAFSVIGALTPASPIPAGSSATFTVTFSPAIIGLSTGTITIDNSDADESTYDFAVQGTGVSSAISPWDPILYPSSPCSWTAQDNNTSNSPYASWSLAVAAAESAGTNAVISLQPNAYIGNFDYDNLNGNESCLGHSVSATMDLTAAQNGMQILGSAGGCMTVLDLNSGSASDQWGNFTGMDGLTIKNIYLRQWGGAISMVNCTNVLIEDCVFEDVNNLAANAISLSGCTNVTFRRCTFLGNTNSAGRALSISNSGTVGSRILLEDCEFGCNTSGGSGAALRVGTGSFVQVTGGTFSGNNSGAGGRGGAVNVLPGGDVVFSNTQFMLNKSPGTTATDGGGAIFVDGNSTTLQTTVLVDGCNFYQNTAGAATRGGAIACIGNSAAISKSSTTIQNSRFEMNGGDRGGALLALNSTVVINNNVFVNNQSAALTNTANVAGGAISFQNTAGNYTITNNTFTNNLSAAASRAINDAATGSAFVLTGNLLTATAPVQTENLPINNTGGTAGSSISLSSLSSVAPNYDCTSGSYCAFTVSGSCLSNTQSGFICSPAPAASGSVTGQVWHDVNSDGIQVVGDLGIAGAFVLVYDASGYLVGQTTTDASGNYTFSGLLPGNYTLVFVNPSISTYLQMSPANAGGSTETTDSDQASVTYISGELRGATSGTVTIVSGGALSDVDAGFTQLSLPIELMYFTARKEGVESLLQWSTASEINNDYTAIERSGNGIDWSAIGKLDGTGNSTQLKYYEYVDTNPLKDMNYYRLVQHDFDGTITISPIAAVQHGNSHQKAIYPNPASDFIMIASESSFVTLSDVAITDLTGRTMDFSVELLSDKLVRVDLSGLNSGVYYVYYTRNGQQIQEKFVLTR